MRRRDFRESAVRIGCVTPPAVSGKTEDGRAIRASCRRQRRRAGPVSPIVTRKKAFPSEGFFLFKLRRDAHGMGNVRQLSAALRRGELRSPATLDFPRWHASMRWLRPRAGRGPYFFREKSKQKPLGAQYECCLGILGPQTPSHTFLWQDQMAPDVYSRCVPEAAGPCGPRCPECVAAFSIQAPP